MTHDISSMLAENDPCMWGRATLVMLVSSTCITVTSITEKVMAHLCVEPKGASPSPRVHGEAFCSASGRVAMWGVV